MGRKARVVGSLSLLETNSEAAYAAALFSIDRGPYSIVIEIVCGWSGADQTK